MISIGYFQNLSLEYRRLTGIRPRRWLKSNDFKEQELILEVG